MIFNIFPILQTKLKEIFKLLVISSFFSFSSLCLVSVTIPMPSLLVIRSRNINHHFLSLSISFSHALVCFFFFQISSFFICSTIVFSAFVFRTTFRLHLWSDFSAFNAIYKIKYDIASRHWFPVTMKCSTLKVALSFKYQQAAIDKDAGKK